MEQIIQKIRKKLKKNVDPSHKNREKTGFKEKAKEYGVQYTLVRKISRNCFIGIRHLTKQEIFLLCEELLASNYQEKSVIAFDWAFRLKKEYQREDFKTFENWLKKYVSNWAKCDDFCTHAFGEFILQFPGFLSQVKLWAKSKNRWFRRGAAVILILPIRKDKKFLPDIFEIANKLLLDKDDLVQKGYGWLLKEASNLYPKEVFNYVMKHKEVMPRTALRYAIEKLPKTMKQQAMTKAK